MNLTWLFYLSVFASALSISVHSQTKVLVDTEKLEAYLHAIQLNKNFNGEILVAKGEDILFHQSVGKASYENDLDLSVGSTYRIASITKTFTGTLFTIAREEQKLNFQDKAGTYIKELSFKFKDISIEHLLNHTSGLPHNEGIEDYWQVKSKLQMNPEQVLTEINRLDLLFEPGTEMSYSSLGYYLLALILENIYEQSFEELLKARILDKLQMTETGIFDNLKIIPQMASGYHLLTDDSLVVAPYRNHSMVKGAGDMYSTATDLLKWNNSFFSNSLLNEETIKSVFPQHAKSADKSDDNYSYGWYVNAEKAPKFSHGGGTWGYSTYTAAYPESRISIIIMSNISTLPISAIAEDIEKIVFGKAFQMPTTKEVSKVPGNLKKYCGNFISDKNEMALSVSSEGNRLFAKLGNNPSFEIYPMGEHQFFGKKIEIEFTFKIHNDQITGLTAARMGQVFRFTKKTD